MRVSLVVATKGRDRKLHRLFDSLVAQSHRDFEVILVDQNSQEFLAKSLALYSAMLNLRRVFSPPGLSRARNIGLQNVTGELICFPDDDCWYAPDLLANIAQEFTTNEKLIILVGKTVDAEQKAAPESDHNEKLGLEYR